MTGRSGFRRLGRRGMHKGGSNPNAYPSSKNFFRIEETREANSTVSGSGAELLGHIFPALIEDFIIKPETPESRTVQPLQDLRSKPAKALSNDVLDLVLGKITYALKRGFVNKEHSIEHLNAIRRTLALELARRKRGSPRELTPDSLDLVIVELRNELERGKVKGGQREHLEGLMKAYAEEWMRRYHPNNIGK